MAAYATVDDVKNRMTRELNAEESRICGALLEDAAAIIDERAPNAAESAKKIASARMVIRALGDGGSMGIPIGASQGSMSGLGYSQSWTMSGGLGELYLSKTEKELLGIGNCIGAANPLC